MNLLMVGSGSGSWAMRGVQLGGALGARVTTAPTADDWRWADLVVLVKRAGLRWAATARAAGVPIVWDALDFWKQPADNGRTESDALFLLKQTMQEIQPVLTIGATDAMAQAANGVSLTHHSWTGLKPTPARYDVRVIGYDGRARYLDTWGPALHALCAARGWTFVVNPPDLSAVDILVALRGGIWDGWMCREWKSGVKLVNAICAGRPVITQYSAAWRELKPSGTVIDTPAELGSALDHWRPLCNRADVADLALRRAPAFSLAVIAKQYQEILENVGSLRAAC